LRSWTMPINRPASISRTATSGSIPAALLTAIALGDLRP
jgi:hypothetical protein